MQGVSKTASESLKCKEGAVSPLLALLYHHRSVVMHAIVESGLACTESDGHWQLLVLGCGLDTSYEERFAGRAGVDVFQVDLPEVMAKREVESPSAISADLRKIDSLEKGMKKAGFCFSTPTVVLTEMVLNYLPTPAMHSLLSFLSSTLRDQALFVSYDLVLPSPPSSFARAILDKFAERGAPLLSVQEGRTAQRRLFRRHGWHKCRAISMQRAFSSEIGRGDGELSTGKAKREVLPFDEFSSLARLEQLYTLTLAGLEKKDEKQKQDKGVMDGYSVVLSRLDMRKHTVLGGDGGAEPTDSKIVVGGQPIQIQRMGKRSPQRWWKEAAAVYSAAMEPYASKYPPVRKFVKNAMKQFSQPAKHFRDDSSEEGSLPFWVATIDSREGSRFGDVVGCIALRSGSRAGDGVEVSHMSVSEEYRGLGVGSALLRACLTASAAQKGTVTLSVLKDLADARRLYAQHGFREDRDPQDLGKGCVLACMVKDI